MAKETPPFTWTGWGLTQAADYATAASTYLHRLKQARDLHDRALAHAEFVKMQIEKCDERAKELSDALAAADNFVGDFVSLFRRKRRSSAKRSVRQSAAKRSKSRVKRKL
jgi:hypothetical protein